MITNNQQKHLSSQQQRLLRAILEQGLPLIAKPYLAISEQINSTEIQVLEQIAFWQQEGLIKRFGLVVKHRQLGYRANAMVVWNIDDNKVDEIASQLSKRSEISLCYRRPRRLPNWPYNLFCMIHGKSRSEVEQQIKNIVQALKLQAIDKDILFSTTAYKQQGARYISQSNAKTKTETSAENESKQKLNLAASDKENISTNKECL